MSGSSNQHIDQELLVRFLSGDASEQEINKVRHWIMADERNKEYVDQMSMLWEAGQGAKDFASVNTREDWKKIKKRIDDADNTRKITPQPRRGNIVYQVVRTAAVITILISAYIAWPILTGHWTDKTTVITSGNPSQVTLPDGSKVYLNKNSHLTYAKNFAGGAREVELVGEAFFEVKKNDVKPFLIKSGEAVTEVVGTSFNVNGVVPNNVIVTVLTGKVFLYNTGDSANKIAIDPGKQGRFKKGEGLTSMANQDVNFLSWKTGELVFHNTSLPQVIYDLNRHYGQHIELASPALENCTLTSAFRQQKIAKVLEEMQLVLPIRIQKKGDTISITGEGCNQIE